MLFRSANITGTSLSVTGNVTAGNLVTSGVTINTTISSSGNVTAPNFIGNVIGNISGNITAPGSNTQVVFNDNNLTNASAGFTFNKTTNAASITGNLTAGNASATLFTGNLSGTGNSNVGNIGATLFVGNLSGTGNSNVGNLGATGVFATTLSATGNANVGNIGATRGVFTNIVGTLETASQPNITSVGTLTSLSVSGNANIGNIGTAGLITATGNITGGNVIATLFIGNLSGSGNSNVGNIGATNFVGALSGAATTAGTVTTNAQPNITSVGTLTSLSVSGNLTTGGYRLQSISTGQTATGSTQGTALSVNKDIFEVTTVVSGANGVVLPTSVAGMSIVIMNNSANSLNVYPATGGQVNSLGTNASFPLGTGGRTTFVATSSTQWYTLTAIYG